MQQRLAKALCHSSRLDLLLPSVPMLSPPSLLLLLLLR
jgi:hypothetical protein